MTEEQMNHMKEWIARNSYVKNENWLEGKEVFHSYDIDSLWKLDEERYQMHKMLHFDIDKENLSAHEQQLCKEASSLCSYISELCGMILYSETADVDAQDEE